MDLKPFIIGLLVWLLALHAASAQQPDDLGDTRQPALEGDAASMLSESAVGPLPVDGPRAEGVSLDCRGSVLPIMAPEVDGIHVACSVGGAALDEPDLGLRFTLTNGIGGVRSMDVACVGAVDHGAGVCESAVLERSGFGIAELSVEAVLLPSGRLVGPVAVMLLDDKP